MVRNLGCFRLLSDPVIKKVTSGVSVFEKHEELTGDSGGAVALLAAEGGCLLGPGCRLSAVGVACSACRIPSGVDVE